MTNHSIIFERSKLSIEEALSAVRLGLRNMEVQPGGHYTLTRWSQDSIENDIVAVREGLGRDEIAQVVEPPDSYNDLSYELWVGTTAFLLGLRAYDQWTAVSLVFLGDAIAGRRPNWLLPILSGFCTALGSESAILCDENDEADTWHRLDAGESLALILLARVRGLDPLPPPLFALMRRGQYDPVILAESVARGVQTRVVLGGYICFTTLEL